jgi:FkbM family methyltransferase
MTQFLATLEQIAHAESVNPVGGVFRHLKWQVRKLLNAFPCELELSHSRLRVADPRGVAALVNAMGVYDYNNMEFVRACLQSWGGTFVDVGANIGSYTLIASEIKTARVLGLEAHPRTFALLAENVRRNAASNVTCLNVAASDREGQLEISDGLESSLNHIVSASAPAENALQVSCKRLETVFRELEIDPTVIKIDVEGYELAVLLGLGEFRSKANAILVEGGERDQVRDWMAQAGYAGPWFVHFRKGILASFPRKRREDPVYIRHELRHELCNVNSGQGIELSALLGRGQRSDQNSTTAAAACQ